MLPEHLLLGILEDFGCVACRILVDLGASLDDLRSRAESQARAQNAGAQTGLHMTAEARNAIDLAYLASRQLNNTYLGTEHLLLGLVQERGGRIKDLLLESGIRPAQILEAASALQKPSAN